MTTGRKYIAWGAGILTWVFGLDVLLAYLAFGYMDWATIAKMAMILVPLLTVAAAFFHTKPVERPKGRRAIRLNRMAENTR